MNFLRRDFLGEEGFAGVVIGDEEMIAGGAGPGGVNFDGVGDDGDDGNLVTGGELAVHHVGVEGVGVYDHVGLELAEETSDGILGFRDEGEWL